MPCPKTTRRRSLSTQVWVLGCPETLVPSPVTIRSSKETVGLAQLPWPASTPLPKGHRGTLCVRSRFDSRAASDILIHAPVRHPHVSQLHPLVVP